MSGFDSNPFADPYAGSPFSDPAITQVTNQQAVGQGSLADYNPFGDEPQTNNRPKNPEPAVLEPIPEPPPAYTPSATVNTAELQRKQEELEKKAAELQAREEALKRAGGAQVKANNWPPIPEKCCTGPCFYQDISVEIPSEYQKLVRTIYYLWMYYVMVLLVNVFGGLAIFISNGDMVTFMFGLINLLLFTPLSFVCWFRPLYKAFRSDSSFNFMVFFFVFSAQFVLTVLYATGIPGMGSCGLITAIQTLATTSIFASFFVLISAALWILFCVFNVYFLMKVHKIYRGTGASFAKAQEEFTVGVLRNEHVQNAAVSAATQGARQNMNQNFSGNRY